MTATKRKIPVPAGSANREKILSARAIRSAARREAILGAALDEFSARGFAAARLDDVAKRAGVAKGTIYLHFRDKEALFQEIVRSVMGPFVGTVEGVFASDIPLRTLADHMVELFSREVFGTRRKDIIRLIMTEGPRFPKLAEFYYREVLSRILKARERGSRAGLSAGKSSTRPLPAFRRSSPRPPWSRSSGPVFSIASSRSTCGNFCAP